MASFRFIIPIAIIAAVAQFCDGASTNEYYSSRTLYEDVMGIGVTAQPSCRPVALWALVKSGISYPSPAEIQELSRLEILKNQILDIHGKWGGGELSEESIEQLRNWTFDMRPEDGDTIVESGVQTISSFAERLQKAFPNLLRSGAAHLHTIKHNSFPSSVSTANIVATTLYKTPAETPGVGDIEQSLQKNCPAWNLIQRNAEAKAQPFRDSELINGIVTKISRKFGFNKIRYDVVRDAYRLCSYERAISNERTSVWCSFFDDADLEAFDYEEDLVSFYTSGPGNQLSPKISCSFFKTLIQNFEVHRTSANVNIQIGSGLLIRSIVSALGFGQDEELTSENFSQSQDRFWRNSDLSPFSGNLVFVLNECGLGRHEYRTVSLFVNERQATLPCGEYCELSAFRRFVSQYTSQSYCNNSYCKYK